MSAENGWTTAWKGASLPRAVARARLRRLRRRGETGLRHSPDAAWAVSGASLLEGLADDVAADLSRVGRRRELARRRELVLEEGQDIFVLEWGCAKLCAVSEDGKKVALDLLGAGDLFGRVTAGAEPVLSGRQLILEALEPTCVLALPRSAVEAALRDRPDLTLALVQRLEDGQRQLMRRLEALVFKDLRTRVAETLLALCDEVGEACAHGFAVDVRLSQQDVADLVGATRQRVNRAIRELSRGMYVQRIGRVLCVLDRERLADLVGLSPG